MKSFIKIVTVLVVIVALSSCQDKRSREVQYMADTDMYVPVSYETYGESTIGADSTSARLPVANTISRGNVPYDYPNSQNGYLAAKDSLLSPLKVMAPLDSIRSVTKKNLDQGKYLYGIYCTACHGTTGNGQGPLVMNEKILGVPNYKDRDITEGNIYHVLMYGKGIMGSHSSQLNATERWQIVHHVEQLRTDLLK
jgi:mono/diheme cytochrome c family protein